MGYKPSNMKLTITLVLVATAGLILSWLYRETPATRFNIHNKSNASPMEIKDLGRQLDSDLVKVKLFLKRGAPKIVDVTIDDACKIPSAHHGNLQLYRCRNRIPVEALLHELTHIVASDKAPRVIREGLAVYVDESLSDNHVDNFPMYQQSLDAWMTLFIRKKTVISLFDVLRVSSFDFDTAGSVDDAKAWQTYVEAGAFVKWVIEKKGWNVFWKYYQDNDPAVILSNGSIQGIEDEWFAEILKLRLSPKSCQDSFLQLTNRFKIWCEIADPA